MVFAKFWIRNRESADLKKNYKIGGVGSGKIQLSEPQKAAFRSEGETGHLLKLVTKKAVRSSMAV